MMVVDDGYDGYDADKGLPSRSNRKPGRCTRAYPRNEYHFETNEQSVTLTLSANRRSQRAGTSSWPAAHVPAADKGKKKRNGRKTGTKETESSEICGLRADFIPSFHSDASGR